MTFKESMAVLGLKLRKLREEQKLTEKDLGKLVGCSQSSVCNIENGKWANLSKVVRVAAYFGLEVNVNAVPDTLTERMG